MNSNNNANEDTISMKYQLIVTPNEVSDYLLYVPSIIDNNGSFSSLNNDMKLIDGKGKFQSTITTYGPAIEIISNNDFKIGFEIQRSFKKSDYYGGYPNYFLSMDLDKDGNGDSTEWGNDYIENYFYINASDNINVTVKLIFTIGTKHWGGGFELEGFSNQNGWNIISGTKSYTMD